MLDKDCQYFWVAVLCGDAQRCDPMIVPSHDLPPVSQQQHQDVHTTHFSSLMGDRPLLQTNLLHEGACHYQCMNHIIWVCLHSCKRKRRNMILKPSIRANAKPETVLSYATFTCTKPWCTFLHKPVWLVWWSWDVQYEVQFYMMGWI